MFDEYSLLFATTKNRANTTTNSPNWPGRNYFMMGGAVKGMLVMSQSQIDMRRPTNTF